MKFTTARRYFARAALGALLANATVTCSDNDSSHPTGTDAGEAGESSEGGASGDSSSEAGAPEAGAKPIGGHGGADAGDDGGRSAGKGGSAGNGTSGGGTSGGGTSGGGTSGGGTSGGGTSGAGTSGGGTGGGGTGGGGTSGAGTSGGGTSGGGTSGAGTSGAGTSGAGTSGAGTSGAGTSGGGQGGSSGFGGISGGSAASGSGAGGSSGGGGTAGQGGSGGSAGGAGVCPSQTCATPWSNDNCGSNCEALTSLECLTCQQDNCAYAYCSTLTDTLAQAGIAVGQPRRLLCNKMLACLRDTGCYKGAASSTQLASKCYCGTVPFGECTAQTANGPCREQFEMGLETSSVQEMENVLFNPELAGGVVFQRLQCEQGLTSCADAGCFVAN